MRGVPLRLGRLVLCQDGRVPSPMITIDQVRRFAMTLPRTTEALVRGRLKFRVGRIVYVAFSRDERVMGFGFPKEQRDWLVGGEPNKFMLPVADVRTQAGRGRVCRNGGSEGIRTPYLLSAIQALSQLSYGPTCSRNRGERPV